MWKAALVDGVSIGGLPDMIVTASLDGEYLDYAMVMLVSEKVDFTK
jgi:hypothetical protein